MIARFRLSFAIAAILFGLSGWTPALSVSTVSQREIEEGLTCQCGCGLTVASCNHLECSFAVPVRKHIAEALAQGQTAEEILAYYKKEYGEKVLSSPVPEGFNLLAWIAPFVGIVVAGGAMFSHFRRKKADAPAGPSIASTEPVTEHTDARLAQLGHEVEDLRAVTVVFAIVLILIVAAFVVAPFLDRQGEIVAEAPARRGELWAREKAVAVLAITEADFDRATGKLSDDDYRVLRSDYEGRALLAMDEMDKLGPALAEQTVRFCAGCGSPFSEADAFCGSCGRPRLSA